jgi:hypothetical protein
MSSLYIRTQLDGRLASWAATKYPNLPIAYENTAFTKPTNQAWLEVFLIPARTLSRGVDAAGSKERGIYQVNIWTPVGGGMGFAEELELELVALFPVMPKFSDVSVDQTPSSARGSTDTSGWRVISISVYYRYES